jgi:hypothetical protein
MVFEAGRREERLLVWTHHLGSEVFVRRRLGRSDLGLHPVPDPELVKFVVLDLAVCLRHDPRKVVGLASIVEQDLERDKVGTTVFGRGVETGRVEGLKGGHVGVRPGRDEKVQALNIEAA